MAPARPLVLLGREIIVSICLITAAAGLCVDGQLRLVNGRHQFEGRLEVCLGNQWGTICDDYWKSSSLNAQVACRQLGFSDQDARTQASDPNNFRPPPFGHGSGPIFWDDVQCTGSEQRLEECPHLTTLEGSQDCIHDEDVGVTCQPLPDPLPPTTTSASSESPTTHQIITKTNNLIIDIDIDIDININVSLTKSQTQSESVTTSYTSVAPTNTEPNTTVQHKIKDINKLNLYTQISVIPVTALVVSVVLVVLMIWFCKRKREGKCVGITNIENNQSQSSGSTEHHFITMTQNDGQDAGGIIAGSGRLAPNSSYELRKILQKPVVLRDEIEARQNPAYAATSSLFQQEVDSQVASHYYETISEMTRVYYNRCALLHYQHTQEDRRAPMHQ